MKNLALSLAIIISTLVSQCDPSYAGKIQKQDIKTSAECIAAGATDATCLPTTAQIYESITAQKLSTAFSSSIVGTLLGESKVSLTADVTNTLQVGNGGSGAASFTANNVLLGNGSSAFQTVAPSTNGNILQSNGTTWQSVANPAAPPSSYEISNIGIASSVATNAWTLALKQSDGSSDCTAGSPCKVGFRSSTVTSGAFNQRSITAALSITVPSGTTLGTVSSQTDYVYLYVIDNAGTPELAVSLNGWFDTGSVVTTTAISGGTSRSTLYSTSARTNVPARLIGRMSISETTAGTWGSNAVEVSTTPFLNRNIVYANYTVSANFAASTTVPINFDSKADDLDSNVSTSPTAWKFTAPTNGIYEVDVFAEAQSNATLSIYKNGTLYRGLFYSLSASNAVSGTMSVRLLKDDFIDIRPNSAVTISGSATVTGVNVGRIVITRSQIF